MLVLKALQLEIKHLEAGAHTTKNSWGFSSAGRAPALHAGGQEFESPNLHQYISLETIKFQAFLFPYYSAFLLYLKTCLLILCCIRDFEKKYREFDM